ncbi:MAG: hypothetical protein HY855_01770 [Burkholderiales bacterium]|nr:hypothetical protein [Burkholderiales bacterium]
MSYPVPTRRRCRWPAVLALLMLGSLLALALGLYLGIEHLAELPVTVVVNGDEVTHGFELGSLSGAHKLVLVAGVLFALLVVALVVPLTLLLVVLVVGLVLALALGLPLLVAALLLGVAASPLLLPGLLLWWALRTPRRAATPPSATIRA